MHRFEASYPAVPMSVRAIRGEVAALARKCGLSESELADIALAVSEAASNAVLHGATGEDPCVRVTVQIGRGELHIVVCDDGRGVKPRLDSPGAGLGLPIIATVTKHFELVTGDDGTEVHMAFPCPNAAAA